MRIFRALKLFKLATNWPELNFFVKTMGDTIVKIGSFSVILLVFIFTYSIMGMELFGYKLRVDYDNNPINYFKYDRENASEKFGVPSCNFDTLYNAFISVYIVLANDGWTTIYFDCYRMVGGVTSTVFFISLFILGQLILFNLFLSILLKDFDSFGLEASE